MGGPWFAAEIFASIYIAGAGSLLYQVRGNLNCHVESGHCKSYCVAQFSCPLPRAIKESLVLRASSSWAGDSGELEVPDSSETRRKQRKPDPRPARHYPTHCASALSSDTTRRPRRCIPGGHALPSTTPPRSQETAQKTTWLWLLGFRDRQAGTAGLAWLVLSHSQGLSLEVLALPRR